MPRDPGTIDITEVVGKSEATFNELGVAYVYAKAIVVPGLQWLALPVVRDLFKLILEKIIGTLSGWAVMQGFFLNTAVRKASQAGDFVDAVNARESLPPTATDEEYEKAEREHAAKFVNFVTISN